MPGSAEDRTPPALAAGLLAALAAAAALFALAGLPAGHSQGFNLAWIVAFEDALGPAEPWPRHLPGLWFGLGGLDFFFYGPLPFFAAAGPARWLCPSCGPDTLLAVAGGLLWAASGLAVWPFLRRFMAPLAAAAGAAVYMAVPYHLGIDWAVRQAIGEFAAYVFVPLVALGFLDALEARRNRFALPLGLAGLLFSHLPTALLAAHVFGAVWLASLALAPGRTLAALPRLALQSALGAALAALYWLPAVVLLGDVSPEALYGEKLTPDDWLFLGGSLAEDTLYKLALIAALGGAALAAGIAVWLADGLADGALRRRLILWAVLPVGLTVLLNSVLSAPLWEHWVIGKVQLPYRLLVFSDLAAALAAGSLAGSLAGYAGLRGRGLIAAAGLAAPAGAFVVALPLVLPKVMAGAGPEVRMIGAPEYLPPPVFAPIEAERAARGLRAWDMPSIAEDRFAAIAAGDVPGVLPVETRPRHWRLTSPPSGPAVLAVPYWRHLEARTADGTGEGEPLALAPGPEHGLAALDIPPGTETVEIVLPWHWSETAGLILSLLGLAGLAATALFSRGFFSRSGATGPAGGAPGAGSPG